MLYVSKVNFQKFLLNVFEIIITKLLLYLQIKFSKQNLGISS